MRPILAVIAVSMLGLSGMFHDALGQPAVPPASDQAVSGMTAKILDVSGKVLEVTGKVLNIEGRVLGMQVAKTQKETRIELPADILFDFDKFDIRKSAEPALKQAGEILRREARGTARIDGHTDSKGIPGYNLKLSRQRAELVRRWLVEREGLSNVKFIIKGYGATAPAAPNTNPDGSDNPEGRQKNRRVEIVFRR